MKYYERIKVKIEENNTVREKKGKIEDRQTSGNATIGGVTKSMDMKAMETRSEPSNCTFDMSPCMYVLFANQSSEFDRLINFSFVSGYIIMYV